MKARILTSVLGSLLAAVFVITPVFAYHPHDGDGYSDYEYNDYGYDDYGYSDYGYDNDRDVGRDFYGGYGDYGYRRPPYYGNDRYSGYDDYDGSGHSSGLLGYWGRDARHHNRGHRHHHPF